MSHRCAAIHLFSVVMLFIAGLATTTSFAQGFTEPQLLGNASSRFVDYTPRVVGNGRGNGAVAFVNTAGSLVVYEKAGAGPWAFSSTIGQAGTSTFDVAINPSGAVVAAGCSSAHVNAKYKNSAGSWSSLIQRSTMFCDRVRVAINSAGRAAMAYFRDTAGAFSDYEVVVLRQNADGTWPATPISVATIERGQGAGQLASYPGIAMDDAGNILVVWSYWTAWEEDEALDANRVAYARIASDASSSSGATDLTTGVRLAATHGLELASHPPSGQILLALVENLDPSPPPQPMLSAYLAYYSGTVSSGPANRQLTTPVAFDGWPFVGFSSDGDTRFLGWKSRNPSGAADETGRVTLMGSSAGFERGFRGPTVQWTYFISAPRVVRTRSGSHFVAYAFEDRSTALAHQGKFLKVDEGGSTILESSFLDPGLPVNTNKGVDLAEFDYDSSVIVFQRGQQVFVQMYHGTSAAPGAPTNLQATVSGHTIALTWERPSSGSPATAFELRARASAGGRILVTLPMGDTTAYSVQAPTGTFVLSVAAANATGVGPESTPVTVTTPAPFVPPSAPSGLSASAAGDAALFTWLPPTTGGAVTSYTLLAGASPGFTTPLAVLPIAPNQTSRTVFGVPAGTYYARLVASNPGGASAPSNEVTLVVTGPAAPSAPALAATASGSTVTLTWTRGATGGLPAHYVLVARRPTGELITTATLTGPSASFPGVPSGTYVLTLTAVNAVGSSPASAPVTLVVP